MEEEMVFFPVHNAPDGLTLLGTWTSVASFTNMV